MPALEPRHPQSHRSELSCGPANGPSDQQPAATGPVPDPAALARVAKDLCFGTDVADVAERAVRCAVDLIDGAGFAAVTATTGGVITTLASTEPPAGSTAEEPAGWTAGTIEGTAPGWVLTFSLAPTPPGTDWSLHLYARTAGAFTNGSRQVGQLLAMHVATAMATAYQRDNLTRAIASRDLIGQAKGILMERYRLPADQAFNLLVRVSQSSNRKLHDIAAHLASTGQIDLHPGTDAVPPAAAASAPVGGTARDHVG